LKSQTILPKPAKWLASAGTGGAASAMLKNKPYIFIKERLLGRHLEFRVRLFNILAAGGIAIGSVMGAMGAVSNKAPFNIAANFSIAVLGLLLFVYSYRSQKYQRCYTIAIVGAFLVFFPILFFVTGGYHSGMPAFFVLAVLYTTFMLEGKPAYVISVIELAAYVSLCLIGYHYPQTVTWYATEKEVLTDIIVAFTVVSIALGVTMLLHLRMYIQQQRKLDEQNAVLAQANRMKTEFLANASHEMRTPLTVTSVNVQVVMKMLENMGGDLNGPEAAELLKNAQSEIMSLSRMVGGMLTLASMSEDAEKKKLDFSALLRGGVEMLRLTLAERGNAIETDIEKDLAVFGNADLLAQVLTNILQNTRAHTENGTVAVSAKKSGNEITVVARDTGSGISPEILPRVFERGVSTGGTGYGLFLCKTAVESHGGRIWIESEPGSGTAVFYTLPFYEGQFGGAER
jgi:signal transduction histidine kinase